MEQWNTKHCGILFQRPGSCTIFLWVYCKKIDTWMWSLPEMSRYSRLLKETNSSADCSLFCATFRLFIDSYDLKGSSGRAVSSLLLITSSSKLLSFSKKSFESLWILLSFTLLGNENIRQSEHFEQKHDTENMSDRTPSV